jgi:membrane fusion protein, copper/silver efflux system
MIMTKWLAAVVLAGAMMAVGCSNEQPTTAPASQSTTAAAVEYYCPMHPSVVKAEPGKCPICGMNLVKRAK